MPVIRDEQSEKKESLFLKYEPENTLILKSHLYKLTFHYLQGEKKSTTCKGEECYFCQSGHDKRNEYNYYVLLNGQLGIMNIKPSVFFAIQAIARASKKETRQMSWLVIKEGQGLDTEYTVSKNDNLTPEEYEKINGEVDSFTDKLTKIMEARENTLAENYDQFKGEVVPVKKEEKVEPVGKATEDVNPDDLPF